VPYPVEAWPEGNQRHLAAESALYCRIFTEGLFGIRPTGLRSFQLTPRLPNNWDHAALRDIRAFGGIFDVTITRVGEELRVEIIREGTLSKVQLLESGKSIDVDLKYIP
jgi:cellobiose phosphorylase